MQLISPAKTNFWAIFIVIALLTVAILSGLWPEGKNFEEATGLIEVQEWHELKAKVTPYWFEFTNVFKDLFNYIMRV